MFKRSKIEAAEKIKLIERYLKYKFSINETAKITGMGGYV